MELMGADVSPRPALMVALDFPSWGQALPLIEHLSELSLGYKVGLELFVAEGPWVIEELKKRGVPVFLDLKLHDIPNTVAAATRAAASWGVDYLTVHLSGGIEMLRAAKEAVEGCAHPPHLLGVSVLTSFSRQSWQEVVGAMSPGPSVDEGHSVKGLVSLGRDAAIDGVVCSAHELSLVNQIFAGAIKVVPGIRPLGFEARDQARVATPGEALRLGADLVVVGRPITQSAEPRRVAEKVLAELSESR